MTTEFKRKDGRPLINISTSTNPGDAAGAINQALREHGECLVAAAGRAAGVACKALWFANKFCSADLNVSLTFTDLEDSGGTRYGFAFLVKAVEDKPEL